MSHVLDASAMLAVLLDEPGADRVNDALGGAIVSSVNLSEVVAKLAERGVADDTVRASTVSFAEIAHDFDAAQAIDAGLLRNETRERGLSLGDRACIALARREDATVLTADRVWAELDLGVEVEVIR